MESISSERTFEQKHWNKGESISSCRFGLNDDTWNLCYYPQGIGKRRRHNPVLWLCRQRVGTFLDLEGTLTLITTGAEGSDSETIAINTSICELSAFVKLPLHIARKWLSLNNGHFTIKLSVSVSDVYTSESSIYPHVTSDEAEQETWVRVPRETKLDNSDWKPRNHSESKILTVSDKLVSTTEVKALSNLSRDMQTMYEKKDLSDFILKCDTTEFQVHKCVLSARSPIFASMFQHPVTENRENRVTITDIDACVLQQLLMFVYTGRTNALSYSMARDLYSAADKYAILELKEMCRQFMTSSLTTSTAVEILILADMHNDALLKSTAVNFISTNFEDFDTTKAWLSLLQEHPSLGIEVLSLTVTHLKSAKQSRQQGFFLC
ncbi:TD and POZ domain-containing protein 4-like [Stegodyphus dumicola]|uniref:TD and POZ domain-containing protein 4-like n=1 Tax=Stegodyphus dumicola TaxID=202533 RepID=UPI0015A8D86B|nr:TD and POZ domain-containing protein 4-like [Stegodyphus dumicola]